MAQATINSVLWLEVIHASLAWIIVAFLTSIAGFMLLRLKRGSFSGRLVVLSMFAMVVYSFVDVGLTISIDVLGDSNTAGYELGVNKINSCNGCYNVDWIIMVLQ